LKKKILYFHHSIGLGGAPRSLAFLIDALNKDIFEPLVVMPKRDGNDVVKNLFLDAGAQVIEETHIRPFNGVNGCRCDSLKARIHAALAALPTTLATRRLVRRLKPDLVHINTSVLPFAALGAKLSWMGAPIVVHVRESALKNRWGRLLSFFNRQFTDWFVGSQHSNSQFC